jgi:N-acetylmuramic acid 6-phosphate etherase
MVQLGNLATEKRNPASAEIDRVSTLEMLGIMNREDQGVATAVGGALEAIAAFLDALVPRIVNGGRLFYIGAGTSGRLGVLDASECPPTFGVSPELVQGVIAGGEAALSRATEASEDDPDAGARDLLARGFTDKDTLVGIAASGRTPYVIGALRQARRMGALTAALVCAPGSAMAEEADHAIEVPVGPEILTGSTRLKAGTATKLVLNMVSTGLMIRLGHTYGNLMVNVQPRNQKLIDRAQRIVSEAAGVPPGRAAELFDDSGRDVRVAVVMGKMGVSRQEAEARLKEKHGVLAEALHG